MNTSAISNERPKFAKKISTIYESKSPSLTWPSYDNFLLKYHSTYTLFISTSRMQQLSIAGLGFTQD